MAKEKHSLNEKHIIRLTMAITGETIKSLSEKVGVHPSTVTNMLNRADGTISLSSMYDMLTAMGFKIIIEDIDGKFGGVHYEIAEKPASKVEWEKQVNNEIAAAKNLKAEFEEKELATVKIKTTDGRIETAQVVNAVTEPKKQSGEQPFDFSLKKTDEQLELENAPTFKGKVIQTPDTAIKAAARIARLNDDSLFNK